MGRRGCPETRQRVPSRGSDRRRRRPGPAQQRERSKNSCRGPATPLRGPATVSVWYASPLVRPWTGRCAALMSSPPLTCLVGPNPAAVPAMRGSSLAHWNTRMCRVLCARLGDVREHPATADRTNHPTSRPGDTQFPCQNFIRDGAPTDRATCPDRVERIGVQHLSTRLPRRDSRPPRDFRAETRYDQTSLLPSRQQRGAGPATPSATRRPTGAPQSPDPLLLKLRARSARNQFVGRLLQRTIWLLAPYNCRSCDWHRGAAGWSEQVGAGGRTHLVADT